MSLSGSASGRQSISRRQTRKIDIVTDDSNCRSCVLPNERSINDLDRRDPGRRAPCTIGGLVARAGLDRHGRFLASRFAHSVAKGIQRHRRGHLPGGNRDLERWRTQRIIRVQSCGPAHGIVHRYRLRQNTVRFHDKSRGRSFMHLRRRRAHVNDRSRPGYRSRCGCGCGCR